MNTAIWNVFGKGALAAAGAAALVAYLIGSVNASIIISRAATGEDIRESGSGNAGATNMLRTHGKGLGALTLLIDVLKGVAAVGLAMLYVKYYHSEYITGLWGGADLQMWQETLDWISLPYIAGFFAILGHNFPLYFGFKGGKGVATSLGVVLMLDWKTAVIVLVVALAVMLISKYVSLGSVTAGILYIILGISKMFYDSSWNPIRLVLIILIGGLLVVRHHANIQRLMSGTENKLSFKKK